MENRAFLLGEATELQNVFALPKLYFNGGTLNESNGQTQQQLFE